MKPTLRQSMASLLEILEKMREESKVDNFLCIGGINPSTTYKVLKELEDAVSQGRQLTDRVDVILYSGGGFADDAYKLLKVFRHFYAEVNVVVPSWAKSAATLFAFGADKIVMGEWGEFGPLDVQITKQREDEPTELRDSAVNIQASLKQIEERSRQGFLVFYHMLKNNDDKKLNVNISPKVVAEDLLKYSAEFYGPLLAKVNTEDVGRMSRALDIGKMYAKRMILQYHPSVKEDKLLESFLDYLIYDCPDHGYVIDFIDIQQYLPYAIAADEAPYSEKYAELLRGTYRCFMDAEFSIPDPLPPLIGYVDQIYSTISKGPKNGTKSRKSTSTKSAATAGTPSSKAKATPAKSRTNSKQPARNGRKKQPEKNPEPADGKAAAV